MRGNSRKLPEPVFVSQFGMPEDVERRIANRVNEDMNNPEWNWCGICCVRMVLLGLGREAPSLEEMYRTAFDRYGVFRMVDGAVIGAYHKELAAYVAGEFGFERAWTARGLTTDRVAELVRGDDSQYVIASVSASIRELEGSEPEKKGGHLVLVYDAEDTDAGRVFILHNSAGFASTNTQRGVRVPEARFRDCFSGRAIIIDDSKWRTDDTDPTDQTLLLYGT